MSHPTHLRDVIPAWVIDDDPTPHGHTRLQQKHVRRAAYLLCFGDEIEDDPRCDGITAQELKLASAIHQASYHRFDYPGDLGFKIVSWLAIMGGDRMEEHARKQKEWNVQYGPKRNMGVGEAEKNQDTGEADNGTEEVEEFAQGLGVKKGKEHVQQSENAEPADDGRRRSKRLAKAVQETTIDAQGERPMVKRRRKYSVCDEDDVNAEPPHGSDCADTVADTLESLD